MIEIDDIFSMSVEEVEKGFPPDMERFELPNEQFSAALSSFATAIIDAVNSKATRVRPVVIRIAWDGIDKAAQEALQDELSNTEIFTLGLVMSGIIEYYLGSMDQLIQQTNTQLMAAKMQIEQLQKPKEKSRIITLH